MQPRLVERHVRDGLEVELELGRFDDAADSSVDLLTWQAVRPWKHKIPRDDNKCPEYLSSQFESFEDILRVDPLQSAWKLARPPSLYARST
ncbi:hypothetical protein GLAREA_02074 [Glarea lozoyensis ATCC 20868]|uniref:Uncharacterized protein n=1 Tax=Glarea lozoyensis (strain ATCC 20868 / MF5171) TaxID=1116229 RepID=S3CI50_GLAL2|nr:uncharacterized protein GLAREA_02074 [Glarea lozoyensis ATCC 20868]EPE26162.1 hypothetical protein GLAREA_02074 [Glarea lozoyensis ATCC 20868]